MLKYALVLLLLLGGCSNKRFDVFYIPERPIIEVSSFLGTVKVRIVSFRIVDIKDDKPKTD